MPAVSKPGGPPPVLRAIRRRPRTALGQRGLADLEIGNMLPDKLCRDLFLGPGTSRGHTRVVMLAV